ncbi:hypothetical protein Vqi01_01700 [Micromonospora qiuiae]|uniref:LysM domain-containing protein n=1 Tax=Micromonospora qiuiae TaxID=502268 RepID=A0ABQ4J4P3_9ACTN|nr:hypothetical protein [Micromonospora qiuiae]GIJ25008.1 hypothetical protein Vqi01_01700 [Micromonospora qiuiae]
MRFWWALPLLLAILLAPLVPVTPAAAAVPEETGKYYVVGPPVDGQREYLYNIALLTLGNGNRFREIIDLNRGRSQPGGATFTDGVELAPGWMLVLPPDADGPGVRTGALPAIGLPTPSPSAPAPSRTTVAPSSSSPSPAPSTTTQQPPPSAKASPPAVALPPEEASAAPVGAAPRGEPGPVQFNPRLARISAAVLAVLFAVVALLVLPRRIHQMRSVTLDDGPWPPERHHTPTPAELEAVRTASPSAPPSGPAGPPPPPGAPPAPDRPAPQPSASSRPASQPPASPLAAPQPPIAPGLPAPGQSPAKRPGLAALSPSQPEWPPFTGTMPANSPAAVRQEEQSDDLPRPVLPADNDVPYVRTEVRTEAGPVMVRLIGVTTGPTTPAYAWLADDELGPPAAVPLVLGRKGPWRLQVDLGRAPDVFTLVGAVDECRRVAAAYARQLYAEGVAVGVVGDALGAETFEGCRSLAGLPTPDEMDSDRCVVITTGLPQGAGMGGRASATGGRCIPFVIGPVPEGRWSAQLGVGT